MFKVLIVDNESIIRTGLCQCVNWQELHCEVYQTASDGLEALRIMEKEPADILITDIRMPGMDGLALAQAVQKRWPATKVIILTGFAQFEYAREALLYDVADFLLKPTSEDKLKEAVIRAKNQLIEDQSHEDILRSLKKTEQENLSLQQNILLRTLLEGSNLSLLYVMEQCARLNMRFQGCFVAEVRMLLPQQFNPRQIAKSLQDSLRYLSGVFDENSFQAMPIGEDIFLLVVFRLDRPKLLEKLQNYIAIIDNVTEFCLRAGVSNSFDDPLLLSKAASQAHDARRFLVFEDTLSCLFFDQIPSLEEEVQDELSHLTHQISKALQLQDIQDIIRSMKTFEETVRRYKVPFTQLSQFLTILYNLCVSILINYNIHAAGSTSFPSLDNYLDQLSLTNMAEKTILLCRETLLLLKHHVTDPHSVAQFLLRYIQTNYAMDLSLESLADLVHLSPSYLSRIVKRDIGENISTLIQNTRIAKAKDLLSCTNQKTYEIAREVGIEDPVYFSRLFKKTTGFKPSEFRRLNRDGNAL